MKKLEVKVRMEEKRLNETMHFKVKILTSTQFEVDLAGNLIWRGNLCIKNTYLFSFTLFKMFAKFIAVIELLVRGSFGFSSPFFASLFNQLTPLSLLWSHLSFACLFWENSSLLWLADSFLCSKVTSERQCLSSSQPNPPPTTPHPQTIPPLPAAGTFRDESQLFFFIAF